MQSSLSKEEKPEEQKKEQAETETDERLYPEEIAGVKRGKPMTPEEAGGKNVNPNYDITSYEYSHNCKTCNVAYNARLQGYKVRAKGFDKNNIMQNALEQNLALAYIDPKTNRIPRMTEKTVKNNVECYKFLTEMVKPNEQYALAWRWSTSIDGHTAILKKDINNEIYIYDAQNWQVITGKENVQKYMEEFAYDSPIKYLRTDNLILFEPVVSKVLEKSEY